jgi:hypothetical protein
MPKSYRIRTEVGQDKFINVKLEQDFEQLEILSLKINQSELYTRVCADYGVIIGRVLVNGGFGVPNAKVSVFIPLTTEDETNPIISELYPYKTLSDVNEEGYRYNLLPKDPSYSTHAATGTFPTRDEVLLEQSYIEVYDKYYKFVVKTNDSGDYMIFGAPTGTQTVVMDVDLSDIGCFSLSPQDLVDSGVASQSQVNGNTFKTSTNLRELPQIKTLNKITEISPLWGEDDICQIGITRLDFDLTAEANIKIEPSAIFMGSVISTTDDDALKTNCKPKNNTGNLCELVAGPGQILAIRQTIFPDSQNLPVLEEYKFEQDGKVIDGDGSFLTKVPMNLDYVVTNEFGQQVLSNDPTKGIPTKGKYRFKFKWENEQGLQNQFLRANFLVPNIKEHGWTSSSNDPFDPTTTSLISVTIPVGNLTGSTTMTASGGLLFEDTVNSQNYTVYINGSPYFGDVQVIPVSNGDLVEFVANPIDDTQPQIINYTFLPQDYFDVLRSYTFSLDWDDYVDTQSAINCEDTFYEFNYNKVYTTSMFLDRYKNGLGRAKHLGIKEIDNRSCKTTVNTFPVNDIIRNFDFIFFIFNILLSVLSPVILVLLFIAHLVSFMWPILKYLLIILGIYLSYNAGVAAWETIQEGWYTINQAAGTISTGVGLVVNVTNILELVRTVFSVAFLIAKAIFYIALALTFTALAIGAAIKVKGFPRIGLPMISYPECNNCECDCKNAEMEDDFDAASIQASIEANQEGNTDNTAASNSFLAPINLSATYTLVDHPNLENRPGFDNGDNNKGWFNDSPSSCPGSYNIGHKSLLNRATDQEIEGGVVAQAVVDFRRIFSGWDIISGPGSYYQKSPEFFLFAAEKTSGGDDRWFAMPTKETYPQKLNEFNSRNKYFTVGGGINQIETTVNPALTPTSTPFKDQVLVLLVNKGTTQNIGTGEIFSFVNPKTSNGQINLTGATLNQFGFNSVTGTTITGVTSTTVQYADPANPGNNLSSTIYINQTGNAENYMQYLPDIEYFQVITGMTVGDFEIMSQTTSGYFPNDYLKHKIAYKVLTDTSGGFITTPPTTIESENNDGDCITKQVNDYVAIEQIENYDTEYEVMILTRGVDPYTSKQTIKYDLSKIFGYTTFGSGPIIEGEYYLNIPIKGSTLQPKSHNTLDNTTPTGLYFQSYTFTPSVDYSGFTSTNPYYYLSTDDTTLNTYSLGGQLYYPINSFLPVGSLTSPSYQLTSNGYTLPVSQTDYVGGIPFIGFISNQSLISLPTLLYSNIWTPSETGWPYTAGGNPDYTRGFALYSPTYYRYTNAGELTGVDFSNKNNIIMRSDRLPTSSCVENGPGSRTGFALHQNNNFCYYIPDGQTSDPGTSFAASLPSGEGFDSEFIGLTQTLTCENMTSLKCYSGSGTNVGVIPDANCVVPEDRVKNGCYCLLNKKDLDPDSALGKIFKKAYLIGGAFADDRDLFVEWKTRFTITFAACRGVFAQTFQNNWINGTLYMFSFNKTATYPINDPNNPTYNYCDDVIIYNDINNGFYYRSSPWNGNDFIGKDSPPIPSIWPNVLVNDYPGIAYNKKQIQFPTTVTDLGPREQFISEICNNDNFNSYFIDVVKTTSYQDNSDLIQIGFLSRILNDNFRQVLIPITNPAGDATEGKGIIQFFNSTRQGDRIDGDFAQMLSINSEWRIIPFIAENYTNPSSIYFGDDSQTGNGYPRPVFGVFFENSQLDNSYRKNLTPGYETLNYSPLLQYYYGFPKTQEVPHYRWKIESQGPSIFGNENNNWNTNAPFYKRGYQDLDFTNVNEYYNTTTTQLGYLTNLDSSGNPQPTPNYAGGYIVGAPFHFYFGLNNGKTAIDKFIKLYITTEG